ncbi:Scr1 family TA system antitoxin-like transcriptional regulator [Sphaerimonospora mesophila]
MFWVVIDEGVLHRPSGGRDVMRRQLERVSEVIEAGCLPYCSAAA